MISITRRFHPGKDEGSSHGTGIPTQVDPNAYRGFGPGFNALDYHSRNYSSNPGLENIRSGNKMAMEEEVGFKLLCHVDKVGSLIGKSGSSEYNASEYRGVNLDALLDMSTNEIVKLFPASWLKWT
ncbi:KH domain-containing protein [Pyrus ussuriensis x Pyrus communis]|uniref:KH domain-containing protein n=1 Tax=Pyrus ussuriensis x Pyrus communis TaxID=2448454 RepID=A0A5N5HCT8_9ROSA|nr:KH domain-containing protein [Pyrus ussuriensis x Pyrus communis]KAB2626370.1 KH domain-containing protein [Pyrus ussuriensis x Pyrus communis]